MEFIASSDLMILNQGNRPTFINAIREEVIDLTLCSPGIFDEISNWQVSREASMSDHHALNFIMFADSIPRNTFRNPKKTNWEHYRIRLKRRLDDREANIYSIHLLEQEADTLANSIVQSYEESCPLSSVSGKHRTPGWNPDLDKMKNT